MRRIDKIYALYKGDVNIWDGTLQEIANYTGKTVKTLSWMTYPAYNRKLTEDDNRLRLIEIPEELESEC